MSRQIDWDDLSPEDTKWLRENNGVERAMREGVDPAVLGVDSSRVVSGPDMNPMENVPRPPRASALDEQGRRYTTEQTADPTDEDEVAPYEQWNVDDLKEELANRGLTTTGKKAELVSRLEEDDAKEG